MAASAISWTPSLCSVHSSEELLTYLCMSDEPPECYDNNIIRYIMQWLERGAVDQEGFFTGLSCDRRYGIILEILSAYHRALLRSEQPFPRGQRPPSHAGAQTVGEQPSPVVVPLSSSSPCSAYAAFPWHTRGFLKFFFLKWFLPIPVLRGKNMSFLGAENSKAYATCIHT